MKTKSASYIVPRMFFVASRRLATDAANQPNSSLAHKVLIVILFLMPISAPSISAQTISIPVSRLGSNIVADVGVAGKTRHFLLDTGAGLTVLSPGTAGWSPFEVKMANFKRLAVGIDGSTHSMGSTTATLELGRAMIITPVAVADLSFLSKALNIKLDGILGQDVLSQFSRVTIDYKNKQLILEK